MANRIPKYETHIRPMIRRLDRDRMLGRFDLWKYDDVVKPDNLNKIVDRISRPLHDPMHGEMPPKEFGGPWPNEWIELFKRWVEKGMPRVEEVTEGVTFSVVEISSGLYELSAKGTNPDFGYLVWLEHEYGAEDLLSFALYREPPDEIPPFGSKDFNVSISLKATGVTAVTVNGIKVPISQSSEVV